MRRFHLLAGTLLSGQLSLFAGASGLCAVGTLLSSCRHVQEEGDHGDGAERRSTTAREDLVGVETAMAADRESTPVVLTRLSSSTRRTSRGLPNHVWGYPSWSVLEDPDGRIVPADGNDECRAYIQVPELDDTAVGQPLERPFKPQTTIVIESKRAADDFVRSVGTMVFGESGWELHRFVRDGSTSEFHEEAQEDHPDAACQRLRALLSDGKATFILGE